MKFEIDKQTLNDLEIFREEKSSDSIFKYFDKTKTLGGKDYLLSMMQNPLTDIVLLTERVSIIEFIGHVNFHLSISHQQFDFISHYLRMNILHLKSNVLDSFLDFASYKLKPNNDYYLINTGIANILSLFKHLDIGLKEYEFPDCLLQKVGFINQVLNHKDFSKYIEEDYKLNFRGISELDYLFRKKHLEPIKKVIEIVHELDAYISISKTAQENKLVFAEYIDAKYPVFEAEQLYHPNVQNPVPYDIVLSNSNLCFLTGPNMAGKSTFLKSMGLSVYLSHIGFPVTAKYMKTSIYNGIITTINLSDNLNKGYSHFYSEVKRVKETALKLKSNKRLFVIFDELFRGTNVKDALDASLAIIKAFSKVRDSYFLISTHITEIAEKISDIENIDFKYFDSKLIQNVPTYNYRLCDGVTHERLGLYIVKNEGIFEILKTINEK